MVIEAILRLPVDDDSDDPDDGSLQGVRGLRVSPFLKHIFVPAEATGGAGNDFFPNCYGGITFCDPEVFTRWVHLREP